VVFIGLLLLVVSGVVGAYFYTQTQMKDILNQRDMVNKQFEQASKEIQEAQEMKKKKEETIRKLEITTTLAERVQRSALLLELANLRPKGVEFVSIDLKSKEVAPPPGSRSNPDMDKVRAAQEGKVDVPKLPAVDVTLNLMGTAPTDSEVAAYMKRLQASDLLTGVALVFSEEFSKEKDQPMVRRFSIEMHVNPEADLRVDRKGGKVEMTANAEK
jgi:Tfp pilus assembly protein PilN